MFAFDLILGTTVTAVSQNYIFASMNSEDIDQVILSMEIVEVSAGDNVVTQGIEFVV